MTSTLKQTDKLTSVFFQQEVILNPSLTRYELTELAAFTNYTVKIEGERDGRYLEFVSAEFTTGTLSSTAYNTLIIGSCLLVQYVIFLLSSTASTHVPQRLLRGADEWSEGVRGG